MYDNLYEIGQMCQEHRKSLGITQKEVAGDLDYSIEAISAFENGRSNNMRIFMWYLKRGLAKEIYENYDCDNIDPEDFMEEGIIWIG